MADTLTSGSHPGSNMPGRRREDDTNLTVAYALRSNERNTSQGVGNYVANTLKGQRGRGGGGIGPEETLHTHGTGVRRLTPVECERLQGFPDGWTDLGPDSRRYAALGDAVTVPVAEWIGRRMMEATI